MLPAYTPNRPMDHPRRRRAEFQERPRPRGMRLRGPMVPSPGHNATGRDLTKTLPPELIVKICEYMVETEVVRDLAPWKLYRSYKKWIPASSTCMRWRKIAFTAPSLWRVIDVGSTGWALRFGLDLVPDGVPLEITFHDPAPIPFFVSTLHKNAHRIEKLIIPELDDRDILSGLTSIFCWSSMPQLKELWVNTVPRTRDDDFQPFIRPELVPNLQAVHFTHLRVNWGSPIIPNLRALSLGCSPAQDRCYLDQFLNIMATCQRLEFLKIDRAFPIFGEDQSKIRIALPKLREVYLTADDPREVHHVLSHIRFDPSVNIDVHIRIDVDGPEHPFAHTGISSVIPYDAACIPVLGAATRAIVKDYDFECWGPGGCGRLALTFDYLRVHYWRYTVSEHAKEFGDLLSRAPVAALTIQKEWSPSLATADLSRLLRKFSKVVCLEHIGLRNDLKNVLMPRESREGSGRVSCITALPQLRALRLTGMVWDPYFVIGLRDCLRARYMAGLFLDDLLVEFRGRGTMFTRKDIEYRTLDAEEDMKQLVRGPVQVRRN
ncbi:hypothetical protein L227DRAFT_376281 [Lentinus tigrinus ALCF2SS1-6]|uniref:F-box domain-containing protein n=1 Tax=Lentinus tigrinus ALCF2SS1-6 TaxID=1328759 RepID=A0A5C2RRJ7_9APHY|nr:hypothetical protein L227DRAFT_376281 [Lentinus tigrinus ALCF2SS1-6]